MDFDINFLMIQPKSSAASFALIYTEFDSTGCCIMAGLYSKGQTMKVTILVREKSWTIDCHFKDDIRHGLRMIMHL